MELEQLNSALALLFPAGGRPSAEDVQRALATQPGDKAAIDAPAVARVTNAGGGGDGWLELLANGLTFDVTGLTPAPPAPMPVADHVYGLPAQQQEQPFEAIALIPGPHLEGGGTMVPVVRTMSMVASELAGKLGAQAICWSPARSWMDPGYFARIVEGWLAGGAFPALGFTGVERTHDGGVESDGLAYFIGQELRVETRLGEPVADTVKLAVRAIDNLVRHGRVERRERLSGPDGEILLAEPSADGKFVRLWREG